MSLCVCDVLPEVVKPHVKHQNMLWKRKCMFKGEKLGQGKSKHKRLFFAVRQRESEAERDKERRKERADYTLVTPCFVPFTFEIIREVLLDQHGCYRAPLSSSCVSQEQTNRTVFCQSLLMAFK